MELPNLAIERKLWQQGYKYIVGIDEVGRGSWAGPLVAGGVIFPENINIPKGLADSKLLKPRKRFALDKIIRSVALAVSVVEVSSSQIDRVKIGKATHGAFRKVIRSFKLKPDFCLVDAFYIKHFSKKNQKAVKNGDQVSASIAAASIVAKVYRDNLMKRLHFKYPNYGFGKHKGYGTHYHQQAIRMFGLSKIHRKSYNIGYLLA